MKMGLLAILKGFIFLIIVGIYGFIISTLCTIYYVYDIIRKIINKFFKGDDTNEKI